MGFWYVSEPKDSCDGFELNVWLLNNYFLSGLFMFYIYCVICNSKLLHLQTGFNCLKCFENILIISDPSGISL